MLKITNGRIIIKTEDDLSEIINKSLIFVIKNKPKKCKLKREDNLITLYENDAFISQSHFEWYLNDKSLIFTNITACENYLKEEANCELIAEALWTFRKENGHFWKKKLIDSFKNGTDTNPSLRRFRNQFDFSLLNKINKNATVREILFMMLKRT